MPRSAELTAADPTVVAVGVLGDARGRILVNRRPPDKPLGGYWEFPGGKIQPGETAWDGLVREFAEELGLMLIHGRHLLNVSHDYPKRSVVLSVWSVVGGPGRPEALEGQELKWCHRFELRALDLLPANGAIVDRLASLQ